MDQEFRTLKQSLTKLVNDTEYNGVKLLRDMQFYGLAPNGSLLPGPGGAFAQQLGPNYRIGLGPTFYLGKLAFDACCLTRNPKGTFSMRNLKKGASLASYSLIPFFDAFNTWWENYYDFWLGALAIIVASLGGGTTVGMGATGGAGAGYYYELLIDLLGL